MTDPIAPLVAATPVYPPAAEMRGRVGVVVPAWFSPEFDVHAAESLLLTTLTGSSACLSPPDIVVVVDGSKVAAQAARAVRARLGAEWGTPFELLELPTNQGKGAALAAGIHHLLDQNDALEWIGARDVDGDHFLDDLPHLYRAGCDARDACPGRTVFVVGSRANVHAPLGWLRGEYELLVNEVLVEALAWSLARTGGVWDTRYLSRRAPDLQSGYKLYARAAAESAVAALREEAAAYPEHHLPRTGMELVPFLTLALSGALCVEVERKTFFDQPVTSYGYVDRSQFYGAKLTWALRRCGLPAAVAALLLDAALLRRPLFTDPDGRTELLRFRAQVIGALATTDGQEIPREPVGRRYL